MYRRFEMYANTILISMTDPENLKDIPQPLRFDSSHLSKVSSINIYL